MTELFKIPNIGAIGQLSSVSPVPAIADALMKQTMVLNLPLGTLLNGTVVNRDRLNNFLVDTKHGKIVVNSSFPINIGNNVEFVIRHKTGFIEAELFKVDNKDVSVLEREASSDQQNSSAKVKSKEDFDFTDSVSTKLGKLLGKQVAVKIEIADENALPAKFGIKNNMVAKAEIQIAKFAFPSEASTQKMDAMNLKPLNMPQPSAITSEPVNKTIQKEPLINVQLQTTDSHTEPGASKKGSIPSIGSKNSHPISNDALKDGFGGAKIQVSNIEQVATDTQNLEIPEFDFPKPKQIFPAAYNSAKIPAPINEVVYEQQSSAPIRQIIEQMKPASPTAPEIDETKLLKAIVVSSNSQITYLQSKIGLISLKDFELPKSLTIYFQIIDATEDDSSKTSVEIISKLMGGWNEIVDKVAKLAKSSNSVPLKLQDGQEIMSKLQINGKIDDLNITKDIVSKIAMRDVEQVKMIHNSEAEFFSNFKLLEQSYHPINQNNWQVLPLPLGLFQEGIFIGKDEEVPKNSGLISVKRFIVEIETQIFGMMQIEGVISKFNNGKENFDLLVVSKNEIEKKFTDEIKSLVQEMKIHSAMNYSVSFRQSSEFSLRLAQEYFSNVATDNSFSV